VGILNLSQIGGSSFSGDIGQIHFLNYKITTRIPSIETEASKDSIMNLYLENFKKQQVRAGNKNFVNMSLDQVKKVCEQLKSEGLEGVLSQAGKMYQDEMLAKIQQYVDTACNNIGALGGSGLTYELGKGVYKDELAEVDVILGRIYEILYNYINVISSDKDYFEYAAVFNLIDKVDPKLAGRYKIPSDMQAKLEGKVVSSGEKERITASAEADFNKLDKYIDQLLNVQKGKSTTLTDEKGKILTPEQLAKKLQGCFSNISGSLGEAIAVKAFECLKDIISELDEQTLEIVKKQLGKNFTLTATNINEIEKYVKGGNKVDAKQDYVIKLENLEGTLGNFTGSIDLTVSHKNLQNSKNVTFSTSNWLKGNLSTSSPLGNVVSSLYGTSGVQYFAQHFASLLLPKNHYGISSNSDYDYMGNSNIAAAAAEWDNIFIPAAKRVIFMAGFIGAFQNTTSGGINMANMICINGRFVSMYSLLQDVLNESYVATMAGGSFYNGGQGSAFPSYAEGRGAIADKYKEEFGYPKEGYSSSEVKDYARKFFNKKVAMTIRLNRLANIF
jgi:ribosome assembly protein YihI (activator of Der GTPase)